MMMDEKLDGGSDENLNVMQPHFGIRELSTSTPFPSADSAPLPPDSMGHPWRAAESGMKMIPAAEEEEESLLDTVEL